MTEQARIYGKVLYELQIPEDMVQEKRYDFDMW